MSKEARFNAAGMVHLDRCPFCGKLLKTVSHLAGALFSFGRPLKFAICHHCGRDARTA